MALPMPRPFRHASGIYYLNVRLPGGVRDKVRGARVTLPIDDRSFTATLTDKCFLSLRTRDPGTARTRFAPALAALQRQIEALVAGPVRLPYKAVVALAGDVYRARVDRDATDKRFGPDFLADRLA